jgi:hypothetical protein
VKLGRCSRAVSWRNAREKLYKTGISPDETYLYARAFQLPYTFELAQTLAGELILLGEKLDVLGCLIDIRGTTSVSSVIEKYEFAYKKARVAGLPRRWRYAFLKDHGDDSLEFIELVMQNAAYMFQVFEDERKAVDWLRGAQSSQQAGCR